MVVSELGPSIEVVKAPMGRLEMDGEGWGKVLSRVQKVVDMTREVVVGHRRRGGGQGTDTVWDTRVKWSSEDKEALVM